MQLNNTLLKLQCDDLLYDGHNRQLVIDFDMSQVDQKPKKSTPNCGPKVSQDEGDKLPMDQFVFTLPSSGSRPMGET